MSITASELRMSVYRLLDQVVETGQPLIVERKGKRLRIVQDNSAGRLRRLTKRKCIVGDPRALVHCDWSKEWHDALP
jgi:hypothetical protein